VSGAGTGREAGSGSESGRGFDTVAIIGLGLIGGCLARDLAACGISVLAYDVNEAALNDACDVGVVHSALDASLHGVEAAQIVVLAVPVTAMYELLQRLATRPAGRVRLITDTCSTKRSVVDAAAGVGLADRFVGGHPLAGDHRAGWFASRTGAFGDAPVYLCAGDMSAEGPRLLAHELWRAVGARPVDMDAARHDEHLALTSHLPQLLATALARTLDDAAIAPTWLGPGGAAMTRLAGSAPDLWTGIACDNADVITAALDGFALELNAVRAALAAGDADAVRRWFEQGSRWRNGTAAGAKPAIP
jgi:cyclohexadieny/prephenate dehydrogenase / 3-phosphoshikimate 1-carboxyvinyltransferase